ncbi:hypothetical protein Tco_0273571 [Tanacetum coccineum]
MIAERLPLRECFEVRKKISYKKWKVKKTILCLVLLKNTLKSEEDVYGLVVAFLNTASFSAVVPPSTDRFFLEETFPIAVD